MNALSGRLAEIEARAAAATPGPWEADLEEADDVRWDVPVRADSGFLCASPDDGVRGGFKLADATFIAAARTDVPALVAALRAAQGEHYPLSNSTSALHPDPLCSCGQDYPCPTVRAVAKALEVEL